jgi:hypothetical protein
MLRRARRLRLGRLAVWLGWAFLAAACATASPFHNFPAWTDITRVRIIITTREHGDVVKEIDDRALVDKIVAFANANLTGYHEPWMGEPLPPVEVAFYDRRLYRGHFGVGTDFFEIHRGEVTFMSRPASYEQVREFMELIGLDESVLSRQS